jgi:hypothetical protein
VLPTFLVIGAMKSGTTSLYEYLKAHPQVVMSRKKEPDFFVEELNLRRGMVWYEEQFACASLQAVAFGEASTSYTKYPLFRHVPSRIAKAIPDVRLIYLIRDPIERMRSQYLHELLLGDVREPIDTALLSDTRYRDFSNYALQLSQYLEYFPREQILVVQAEHLRNDRRAVVRQIGDFIGVSSLEMLSDLDREYHNTSKKRVPRPVLRRIIESTAYVRMSPWMPRWVKRFGRERLQAGVPADRGRLSDQLRYRLEEMVREDVQTLKPLMGPQFDGWGIA